MTAKPKEEKKVEEKKPIAEKQVKAPEPVKKEVKEKKTTPAEIPKLNSEPKVMKGRKKTDHEPVAEETKKEEAVEDE